MDNIRFLLGIFKNVVAQTRSKELANCLVKIQTLMWKDRYPEDTCWDNFEELRDIGLIRDYHITEYSPKMSMCKVTYITPNSSREHTTILTTKNPGV